MFLAFSSGFDWHFGILLKVAKALEDAHDDAEVEKDEDEEVGLWEQQQIKKGASIPASQSEQSYGPPAPPQYGQPVMDGNFQQAANYSGAYLYGAQGNKIN